MKFIQINVTPELLESELLGYLIAYTDQFEEMTFLECSDAIEKIQEYMPKLVDLKFSNTQKRAIKMIIKLIKRRSRLNVSKIYKPTLIPPGWVKNQDPTWELEGGKCEKS